MIAIIDGDSICYHACKARYSASDCDIDDFGKAIPPVFTKAQDERYLRDCWDNFRSRIDLICEMAFADDFVMAVKGEGNYRDDIYSDYKGHRTVDPNSVRASVVPAIRQLAVMEDMAVFANGREADDLVRIWAGEAERGGVDYVIARADKDLACIPGQHLRVFPDMRKATMELITPEHATRFYYEQLLQGDAVDKIPGIPRIGPKKATKLLEDYNTEEDFQNIVLAEYINAFGDNWESHLLSNGKMIYIQKHLNDYFSFDNWPLAKEMRGV